MEKGCDVCEGREKKWYKEKLFIVFIILLAILVSSYFIKFLNPLLYAFSDYTKLIWWAILVGLLVGGLVDYLVPEEYIFKHLGQHKKKTIFLSVMLGFFMAACSHGILAIAIELYKKGASTPAVIAFLLASPWANLPVTILLFGFFGIKALLFVGFAIIIAIISGFAYQFLDKKGLIECHIDHSMKEKNHSLMRDIKKEIRGGKRNGKFESKNFLKAFKGILQGSFSLAKMVLWWILIGMLLAGAARAYIPHAFFMRYMGPTFLGLLVTLALATVIEVCSEGSAPLAFEIFKQTGAFGNPFIFLMAGVATDYTEIGLIWANIGKKAALWLPIITVPQILIIGYLFNILL